MNSSKDPIDAIVESNGRLAPGIFFPVLQEGLKKRIFPATGEARDKRQDKFGVALYRIALYIQKEQDHLEFDRKNEQEIRQGRLKSGRVRAKIQNGLKSLREAQQLGAGIKDLREGWLDFDPALKSAERLEKRIVYLESLYAGLIHPSLRTADEKILANEMKVNLKHPPFKLTPGSQELMHRAVEMLDDEIQKFTRGKVSTGLVNKFISEFLKSFFEWTVGVASVKTILARYKENKRQAGTTCDSQ